MSQGETGGAGEQGAAGCLPRLSEAAPPQPPLAAPCGDMAPALPGLTVIFFKSQF